MKAVTKEILSYFPMSEKHLNHNENVILSDKTLSDITGVEADFLKLMWFFENPVLSIKFYQKWGLKLACRDEDTAFFWVEEGNSLLGFGKNRSTKLHTTHLKFLMN